ncbi:MAG: helix-turn-helix domain-containing protein [Planctomycetota bacterium]
MRYEAREVRLNSCGRTTCAPDWNWSTSPGLPDHDLIAIHGGTGRYREGEAVYPARAGACLVLRRGGRYSASMDPDDPMTVTWVHFDRAGGARERREGAEGLPALYRVLENPAFFFSILDRILEAHTGGRRAEADFWLGAALRELHRQDRRPGKGGRQAERAGAVSEICAQIRADPGARWRLEQLARRAYLSADHFGRLFKRQVGCSPGEFVVRSRIDAAMGLLRTSSHSVTRIAEILSYTDVCAFSRQFRAKTGLTPTAYRRGRTHS